MALFPPIDCYRHSHLPVGQGHQLYIEQSGNRDGVPVVVLHGGPGGGSSPSLRRFFDPQRFNIIVFDQRGAGQSRPLACTQNNTTADLVADLEAIREHLGLDHWILFGGSWGATLALAYLAEHPRRVSGMVLRGIFLCRQQDRDWLYTDSGAARLFPQAWHRFVAAAPEGEGCLLERYRCGLEGPRARRYARAWCNWEATLALMPTLPDDEDGSDDELCMATQEIHYFLHQGFLPAPLLARCAGDQVATEIIQGDRDFVCPADQALALHKALPNSALHWVEGGSHSSSHPAMAEALVQAVQRLETRICV